MPTSGFVPLAQTSDNDYGLDAVAQHNAAATTEEFPPYQEDLKGLGIYQDGFYHDDSSYLDNPPTPHSTTETDGMRTRSGRSTRRTDSPFSTSKSRVSKSPAARSNRSKRDKKSKVLEKAKTPKLTAPLSVLTKDMDVPVKDMDAWVHRPTEARIEEVEKRHGYVTRPMNSFMLYRSAYAERTKAWATQNNHQIVSSIAGESWPMEPDDVRNQFNEWARIERANHAAAHPEYKFSPSKPTKKRRGEFSDDEDEGGSDLDGDPDGEYRASGRSVRQRRNREQNEVAYLQSNVGFDSHPYYGQQQQRQQQQGYEIPQYGYTPQRSLPSNSAYETMGIAYNPHTGTYIHTSVSAHQHPSYAYAYMQPEMRIATPSSQHGAQSLGGYGLPGQMGGSSDELFGSSSRTGTPAQYPHYSHPHHQSAYTQQSQYQHLAYHQAAAVQQQHLYEHQQYLHAAGQPQTAIDPGLEVVFAAAGETHFDEAMGDLGAGSSTAAGLVTHQPLPEYFEESSSPDQTLAPRWDPSAAELGGS